MSKIIASFVILILLFPNFTPVSAQVIQPIYQSPLPGAEFVSAGTTIAVRYGPDVNPGSIQDNLFSVNGSESGVHPGKAVLAQDAETVIFKPDAPFTPGETVSVTIHTGMKASSGDAFSGTSYTFVVSKKSYINPTSVPEEEPVSKSPSSPQTAPAAAVNSFTFDSKDYLTAPTNLPTYTVSTEANFDGEGFFFLSPFLLNDPAQAPFRRYLMIVDHEGNLVYYASPADGPSYFHLNKQPDGTLTFFDRATDTFFVMDSSYQVIDQWAAGNGYTADLHELQILPNGHAILMSYDPVEVDLSRVVPGGRKDAVVIGLILQEIDQSKNVIFEWRSWDHYSLSDTYEPLTTQKIDPYHGNAIEVDTDGNWLISARHLDEITKIDRETGAILWRLGGKANQFTFTNDTRRFKHQHDIRRLPNGNITLFDNSNGNEPQYSRAVEYEINEAEKTITRVWEYRSKPEGYSAAMGSVQRLDNGNTVIGWGWASAMAVSEVNPDGKPVFELNFPIPADPQKDPRFVSYRAFRYPWEGNPINPPSLAGKVEPTGLRLGFSWNGATQVASWEIHGGRTLQSMTKLTSLTKTGFETQTVLSGIDAAQCIYAAVPLDKDGNKLRQSNYYVSAGCQPYQDYIPLARK